VPHFIELHDTGGGSRFEGLRRGLVEGASGIIFVHDLASRRTYDALGPWVSAALAAGGGGDGAVPGPAPAGASFQVPVMVVGTMADKVSDGGALGLLLREASRAAARVLRDGAEAGVAACAPGPWARARLAARKAWRRAGEYSGLPLFTPPAGPGTAPLAQVPTLRTAALQGDVDPGRFDHFFARAVQHSAARARETAFAGGGGASRPPSAPSSGAWGHLPAPLAPPAPPAAAAGAGEWGGGGWAPLGRLDDDGGAPAPGEGDDLT